MSATWSKDMNKLNKCLILLIVYSLLGGQVVSVLGQDTPKEEKPEVKPTPKKKLKQDIWVGRGYDSTGLYAAKESTKESIFNIGADDDGNPFIFAGDQTFEI